MTQIAGKPAETVSVCPEHDVEWTGPGTCWICEGPGIPRLDRLGCPIFQGWTVGGMRSEAQQETA